MNLHMVIDVIGAFFLGLFGLTMLAFLGSLIGRLVIRARDLATHVWERFNGYSSAN